MTCIDEQGRGWPEATPSLRTKSVNKPAPHSVGPAIASTRSRRVSCGCRQLLRADFRHHRCAHQAPNLNKPPANTVLTGSGWRIYTGVPLPPDGVFRERAARLNERVRPFGGVDVAFGINRHAFTSCTLIHPVGAFERRDEAGHTILIDRADPDAVTPVAMVVGTRLRVDRIDRIAVCTEN